MMHIKVEALEPEFDIGDTYSTRSLTLRDGTALAHVTHDLYWAQYDWLMAYDPRLAKEALEEAWAKAKTFAENGAEILFGWTFAFEVQRFYISLKNASHGAANDFEHGLLKAMIPNLAPLMRARELHNNPGALLMEVQAFLDWFNSASSVGSSK